MRPSCAPGWWQILGLAQGEVFGTHWMLLPCSHSSSTVRIWVPLCANLGQEDVDVSPLIPLGLLTLSWRSQGISERCPTQRQWEDPGLEGGCRRPPSCTGISGTAAAAAPGTVRAPGPRRNAAARPFQLVLRHGTG